jgi:hypothetical protein
LGALQPPESTAPPVWRLAQWGTRYPLQPGTLADTGTAWEAANEGKSLRIDRIGGVVSLRLNSIVEAQGRLREQGEPWPHLLIEQRLGIPVGDIMDSGLRFGVELRIAACKAADWASASLDAGLHTAQVSAYWMVGSVNHNGSFWLGIPFFDVRHDVPPGHFAVDFAESGDRAKFIACLEGERFWKRPTGDGAWHVLDIDFLDALQYGLQRAQEQGHLSGATLSDLVLESFNLGWEITGPYDATLDIKNLKLHPAR